MKRSSQGKSLVHCDFLQPGQLFLKGQLPSSVVFRAADSCRTRSKQQTHQKEEVLTPRLEKQKTELVTPTLLVEEVLNNLALLWVPLYNV